MKVFFQTVAILCLLILLFLGWAVWGYLYPNRNEVSACYLDDSICMDIFYYDRPDINRSRKSLYFTNPQLPKDQQTNWRNEHIIYPDGLFGDWQDCKELNSSTLVCSFQALPKFEKTKCNEMSVDQYPLKDWQLRFFEIKVIDGKNFKYVISEPNSNNNFRLANWKAEQKINLDLWIYC